MKKIIIAVLLVLIIVPLFVFLKYRYSYQLAETNSGIGGYIEQKACDILFVGSSQSRQDYNIKIIDSVCGTSSYILAYNGMQPFIATEVVDYLTREYFKPAVIIMEAYPYLSVQEPRLADTRLFSDAPPDLKDTLINILKENRGFSFGQWYELVVRSENESLLMHMFTYNKKNNMSFKGSYQNKSVKGMKQDFILTENNTGGNFDSILNTAQQLAHKELIEICKQQGIKLIYIRPPVAAPVYYSEHYTYASIILQNQIEDSLGVSYINNVKGFSNFEPNNFSDFYHLSTSGRDKYSELIANVLKDIVFK